MCVRNGLGRLEEEAVDLMCCLVGYVLRVGTAEPWADLLVYSWFTHCCCLHLCLSIEAQSILTFMGDCSCEKQPEKRQVCTGMGEMQHSWQLGRFQLNKTRRLRWPHNK